MTTIKDSVHDHIEVQGVAAALLDTPQVQRLRHIYQLGTVRWSIRRRTTPDSSTRWASITSQTECFPPGIEGQQAERIRAAALLHDVGHSRTATTSRRSSTAERASTTTTWTNYSVTALSHAYSRTRPRSGPRGRPRCRRGRTGPARLRRTGRRPDGLPRPRRPPHGRSIRHNRHERLVRELRFVDGELVLDEGNVQTAESLLLARALMNPTVYQHHVARIAKAMLRRGTEDLLAATVQRPRRFAGGTITTCSWRSDSATRRRRTHGG